MNEALQEICVHFLQQIMSPLMLKSSESLLHGVLYLATWDRWWSETWIRESHFLNWVQAGPVTGNVVQCKFLLTVLQYPLPYNMDKKHLLCRLDVKSK